MRKKSSVIPLSFLAFVLLHIAVFGMPESAADEFGTDIASATDGNSDSDGCPVDMMIILVRDMIVGHLTT